MKQARIFARIAARICERGRRNEYSNHNNGDHMRYADYFNVYQPQKVKGARAVLYVEYHAIKNKYHDAQRAYNELIDEKETMFARTQPAAIRYDKERVTGGSGVNVFDAYLIAKEQSRIDERLTEQKNILEARKRLKELKEYELRASREWHDRIYTLYYLDRLTITQIEARLPYSRVQIWRILQIIKDNLAAVE